MATVGTMPRPQPAALWADLNARQKVYLTVIYHADQSAESDAKGGTFDWGHRPASEWRWLTFSLKAPVDVVGRTAIQYALAAKDEHDQGAGSSLAALRRRALIEVTEDLVQTILGWIPRVRVKLTTLGRATARAGLGHTAPTTTPRGMLSEWLWSNLVRLYRAGPNGLPALTPYGTPEEKRALSEKARFFLERDQRRHGPYITTKRVSTGEPFESRLNKGQMIYPEESRVFLTDDGREHYDRHVRCYAELWPDIDAPVPEDLPETAHTGIADHKVSKPRGLLARAPFVLLAVLVHYDVRGELWLRDQWVSYWTNRRLDPPNELTALPAGITHSQIPHITRSTTAAAKLLTRRGGPLAAEIEIERRLYPPWGSYDQWPENLKVLHLTPAGRAHYATHLATYRTLYDDVEMPDAPDTWAASPPAAS